MTTILVVDDDERMLRLLTLTLPQDYEVYRGSDGEEALRLAKAHQPDVLLLDVNMPKLNGFEVLQQVKMNEALRDTHVILVTARDDEADQNLGRQLGASAYFVKPFSPLALIQEIERLLAG